MLALRGRLPRLGCSRLHTLLVLDEFHIDAAKADLASELYRDSPVIGRDPNGSVFHPARIAILGDILDPRDYFKCLHVLARSQLDGFLALDEEFQKVTVPPAENIKVEPIANFEVDTTSEINRGNRIKGIL